MKLLQTGHNRLLCRSCRGQSTVEFALVFIPIFLLIMGMVDLGRGVYYRNVLSNAAREGARAGITGPRDSSGLADRICARAIAAALIPGVRQMDEPACGTTPDGRLTVCVGGNVVDHDGSDDTPLTCDGVSIGTPGNPADPVRVTMQYRFDLLTPLVANVVGDSLTFEASSAMYVEAPPP